MSVQSVETVVIVGLVALVYVLGALSGRSTRRRRYHRSARFPQDFDVTDVTQQLSAVSAASFKKRKLLNSSEYHVFKIIEKDVADARKGYRVFAQTSLGEILASANEDAFRSINSKRVDILIVDQGGWPLAAIEYQGSGHYQGTAAQRDAIKKEALSKAGIRYIEIVPEDGADAIKHRVREQLGWIIPSVVETERGEQVVPVRANFGQRGEVQGDAKAHPVLPGEIS